MAVCRTDTCNTYENRVLKAFLSLAIAACNQYLGDFDNESNSIHARVTRVRDFKRIANEFYKSEAMATVNTLTSDTSPNYVLQFDPVYAPVWDSYLVLKAKRKQEDVLWQWRHRSIGELFLIDLMASLHAIRTPVQQTDQVRELAICQDPTEGHWLACPVGLDGAKLAIDPEIVCSPLAPLHKHIDSREATPLADAALQLANSRTGQVLKFSFLLLVHDEQPTHHSWDRKTTILVMPDLHQSRDTPEERAESMIRTGILSWPDGHQQRQATAIAVIHRLSRLLRIVITVASSRSIAAVDLSVNCGAAITSDDCNRRLISASSEVTQFFPACNDGSGRPFRVTIGLPHPLAQRAGIGCEYLPAVQMPLKNMMACSGLPAGTSPHRSLSGLGELWALYLQTIHLLRRVTV